MPQLRLVSHLLVCKDKCFERPLYQILYNSVEAAIVKIALVNALHMLTCNWQACRACGQPKNLCHVKESIQISSPIGHNSVSLRAGLAAEALAHRFNRQQGSAPVSSAALGFGRRQYDER